MKLVQIYVKEEQEDEFADLIAFLLNSPLAYEVKETDVTYKGKDGTERPWTMPWGKHKGAMIDKIPLDYLEWMRNTHEENVEKQKKDPKQFVTTDEIMNIINAEFRKRTGAPS